MKITFHGAVQTVTGSQHLLEVNGKRILLDCGLYQGKRSEANARNSQFPFDPSTLDAVILSHAHIDHSGNLPQLVKKGFKGDIICTPPTRDLCVNMLQDSAFIQEKDAEFFNNKIRKKHEALVNPLYTMNDAVQSLRQFTPLGYERTHTLFSGIDLTFLEAGHMLGSAITVLHVDEGHGRKRFVFSGDIGRDSLPIIRDPEVLDYADILVMESTYGNRHHEPMGDLDEKLAEVVNSTVARKGAIIIPSFAVGRTQQLVYSFQKLVATHKIPAIPIFVDSPLATDVTNVFRNHPEVYDDEIRQYIMNYHDDDPFGFANLRYTRSVEESKALNSLQEPFVVISASGMCEAGRILHHLRNRIEDERNTILFVGWQAPDTLGRRILDSKKDTEVRIFGQVHRVRAHVEVMNGLSGHADSDELLKWVNGMYRKPQQTFLVHGELEPAKELAGRLQHEANTLARVPELHQSFDLG